MYKLKEFFILAKKVDFEDNLPSEDDAHGLRDLLNIDRPVNANDYKIPVKPVKLTCSVVEMNHTDCPTVPLWVGQSLFQTNCPMSHTTLILSNI